MSNNLDNCLGCGTTIFAGATWCSDCIAKPYREAEETRKKAEAARVQKAKAAKVREAAEEAKRAAARKVKQPKPQKAERSPAASETASHPRNASWRWTAAIVGFGFGVWLYYRVSTEPENGWPPIIAGAVAALFICKFRNGLAKTAFVLAILFVIAAVFADNREGFLSSIADAMKRIVGIQ